MSLSSKITDDEMRYFQFKARQLYLLRKEDHEWNEFCKNTCTCCTCQTNTIPKVKEVGIQSTLKRTLPISTRIQSTTLHSNTRSLPQTINEIKSKLERIDLTLSEMKVTTANGTREMTNPKEILNQQLNTVAFPLQSEIAESVKSVINERRMQLIQDSLKMSLQRLHSAALKNIRPSSNIKAKKKSRGYFIPPDLERQRVAARRAYLASLEKKVVEPKTLPHSIKEKIDMKGGLKLKLLKNTMKGNLQKSTKSNDQREDECTQVESNNVIENKDENIEAAVDAILDDILGETVLVINKIKQSKSKISSSVMQKAKQIPIPTNPSLGNIAVNLDSKEAKTAMAEQFQNELGEIRQHLNCVKERIEPSKGMKKMAKNAVESEQISSSISVQHKSVVEIRNTQPLKELTIDPSKSEQISKSRKEYWSYLERMSRTKKGKFDPWTLSNLVAESLLDDCIREISKELQDVPTSLIADLYDQEFLQSL